MCSLGRHLRQRPHALGRSCDGGRPRSDLVATVYFTGGLTGPFLVLFAFHMAIGTMMIATRIMYLLASLTSLGVLGLYLAEVRNLLPHQGIDDSSGAIQSAGRRTQTRPSGARTVLGRTRTVAI